MNTLIRLLLGALALAVPTWVLSQTGSPASAQTTGRVLVLKDYRALEGDIERIGAEYRLRRPIGELILPADGVLCLCGSWEEAFALVCRQANLRDPDERLRLAKWCQMNGLFAEALVQATEAVRLRPEHRESKNLLAILKRSVEMSKDAPPPAVGLPEPSTPLPPIDVSAETLTHFTRSVQPILMNTCARCHIGDHANEFKLVLCTDPTINRRGLQQNLAAVLAQLNVERPALSPLLIKAVSAHGGASQAPLPGRQSKPFLALQVWVEMVGTNNPHLKYVLKPAPQGQAPPVAPLASTQPVMPTFPQIGQVTKQPSEAPVVSIERASGTTTPTTGPAPRPPVDAFDPAIFNRQMHPPK